MGKHQEYFQDPDQLERDRTCRVEGSFGQDTDTARAFHGEFYLGDMPCTDIFERIERIGLLGKKEDGMPLWPEFRDSLIGELHQGDPRKMLFGPSPEE